MARKIIIPCAGYHFGAGAHNNKPNLKVLPLYGEPEDRRGQEDLQPSEEQDKEASGVTVLPDGSGFSTGVVGTKLATAEFADGTKVRLGNGREGVVVGKRERVGFHGYVVRITESADPLQVGQTVGATADGMAKITNVHRATPLKDRVQSLVDRRYPDGGAPEWTRKYTDLTEMCKKCGQTMCPSCNYRICGHGTVEQQCRC